MKTETHYTDGNVYVKVMTDDGQTLLSTFTVDLEDNEYTFKITTPYHASSVIHTVDAYDHIPSYKGWPHPNNA